MQGATLNGFDEMVVEKQERRPRQDQRRFQGEKHSVSPHEKKHAARQARRNKLSLRDIEASLASYD
jgi:hypothetical protein